MPKHDRPGAGPLSQPRGNVMILSQTRAPGRLAGEYGGVEDTKLSTNTTLSQNKLTVVFTAARVANCPSAWHQVEVARGMVPVKSFSSPPAGGPRPRLHRAQQGATNRVGVFVDHLNRAIPYSLAHNGQIARQPRVSTARLKRRLSTAGVHPDAQLRSASNEKRPDPCAHKLTMSAFASA